METIGYTDIDKTFKNVYNQLVDGGVFFMKEISVVFNPSKEESENIKYWEDYWHYKGRSIPLIINKGYSHGFKLISCNDLNESPRKNLEPFYLSLKENELEQKYPHSEIVVHIGSEFLFKKEKQKKWNSNMLKGKELL